MTDTEKRLRELAKAALAEIHEDVRNERWQVEARGMCVVARGDAARWDVVMRCDHETGRPALEHIAASDPHAVLALLDRIKALEADSAAMVADLHAGDAKQSTLTTAAQRASAELRHALRFRKADGSVDVNLVSRAVVLLEEATTPGRPEKVP